MTRKRVISENCLHDLFAISDYHHFCVKYDISQYSRISLTVVLKLSRLIFTLANFLIHYLSNEKTIQTYAAFGSRQSSVCLHKHLRQMPLSFKDDFNFSSSFSCVTRRHTKLGCGSSHTKQRTGFLCPFLRLLFHLLSWGLGCQLEASV